MDSWWKYGDSSADLWPKTFSHLAFPSPTVIFPVMKVKSCLSRKSIYPVFPMLFTLRAFCLMASPLNMVSPKQGLLFTAEQLAP